MHIKGQAASPSYGRTASTIEKILGMGLTTGLLVAFVFAALAFAIPEPLMGIFTSEEAVIMEGAKYHPP